MAACMVRMLDAFLEREARALRSCEGFRIEIVDE